MILHIYAVRDTVNGAFMNPFYLNNDEVAKRSFKMACEDENSNYFKIRKDLQLFKLGTFNDESGEITHKLEFIQNGV